MTERILFQVQAAEMGFWQRVHGVIVKLRDKAHSCEIRKALNIESLSRIERALIRARPCVQNVPRKIGETRPAGYTYGKAVQWSPKDQVE